MMRRILTFAIACLLLLAIMIPTLSGQQRKGLRSRQHHPGMQGCCKGLDLTDDQQTKIADLRLKLQKEMMTLRTELQSKVAEIQLMKTEATPNLNRIDKLIDDAHEIRAKIEKNRVRHQLEVRKLLTPEQQKTFDSRMLQTPERKWRGKGMRGPGCGR